MGCLPHARFLLIQLRTQRIAVNVVSAGREGEDSEKDRGANFVEFWLPCGPKEFGAAGRDWQLRVSVTASGLECTRGRLGGT